MNDSNHDPHSDMTRRPAAEDALEGTPRADDPPDSGVDPKPEVPMNEQPGVAMPLVPERAETVQRAPAQRAAAAQSDPEVVGVLSDERLNAAIAKTRAEALAIAELCELAGQSERIVALLRDGASPEKVRHILLAQRAEQPEIASRITPEAGTSLRPEQSPVVAAVKKLHAQE